MKKQLLFKFKILKKLKAFSLFILIFMASVNLNAQNAMGWTGTTDTAFLTATNWANTLVGWGTSDITINAATNNPVLNTAVPGTGSYINILNINTGGNLTVSAKMWVYKIAYLGGTLTFNTGADTNIRSQARFGVVNNPATVNVNGGTFAAKNAMIIGDGTQVSTKGDATLNVNGGSVYCGALASEHLIIGNYLGTGVVNLNSGLISIRGLTIGTNGTMNIDQGTLTITGVDASSTINNYVTVGKIIPAAGKQIAVSYNNPNTTVTAIASNITWNGTAWSNGTPSSSVDAIINGTYSGAGFNAKKLTINSGKSLTVTSGNMTVQNEVVNNGTMIIENNANLIQVNTATNQGSIIVNRNSNALSRLDYTMWSSPVAGQNLAAFSPLTSQSPSRFYTYDAATNLYSTVASPTTTNFVAGTGYLIRMPNTAVEAPVTETFAAQFTGVPNNGPIGFTGLTSDTFYAVGNPYPSTVSANAFLTANNFSGSLYFWRKTNGTGSAYAVYNNLGGTAASTTSEIPNGTIQVGQGFIVQTGSAATTLNFTNAMRTGNNNNQTFKTKAVEKNRIWLNLTNTAGAFSQALVGYMDGATQGVDNGIDGKYINDSKIALTSNIDGEEYTIQGRPTFAASDVVALNFKTDSAGEYTIAIDHVDGIFAAGQSVYLVDNTTGTETDLKEGAYTFTSVAGTSNTRFSLKYQKTLKVNAATFNDNSVAVYKNKGTLYVNSGTSTIATIKVFDIQGRLIAEQKNVKANSCTINNLKATHQVLVVQVTSEDNKVVNKKVVN